MAAPATEEQIATLIAKLKESEARMDLLVAENEQLKRQQMEKETNPTSTIVDKRRPRVGATFSGRRLEEELNHEEELNDEEEELGGSDELYYSDEEEDRTPKGPVVPTRADSARDRADRERIEEDIAELRRIVSQKVPTRATSLRASTTRCVDNPFAAWITETSFPVRFTMPPCKQYDGTTDPEDHMSGYKHRMSTCNIPQESFEAILCRCFSSSLVGSAQRWFASLPPNTVRSFSELATKFASHFSHNKRAEVDEADLYEVTQRGDESLRKFVKRFNDAKIAIPDCREKTAIAAFIKGVIPDSPIHTKLLSKKLVSFEELLRKVDGQIAVEDDQAKRKGREKRSEERPQRGNRPHGEGRTQPSVQRRPPLSRGSEMASRTVQRYRPYQRENARPKEFIPYPLAIPANEVVSIMKGMGRDVNWPQKLDPNRPRDMSRFCEYHGDHGHDTEQCFALRKEVALLLKAGRLREFMSDKGKQIVEQADKARTEKPNHSGPPRATPASRTISMIVGGSELCGLSRSAAKRKIREVMNVQTTRRIGRKAECEITFTEAEAEHMDEHHDALVIMIRIADMDVKRVLVDNGSSANILFLATLDAMSLDRSKVRNRAVALTGFSGESKTTVGEIDLIVIAEGISYNTTFLIIDGISAYNAILGRPWLHAMRAVPSTYHQVIKFPTKWGVGVIHSEREMSRRCYYNSLKVEKEEL